MLRRGTMTESSEIGKTNNKSEIGAARRIVIDGGGREVPLVPHLPLLSSASLPWEGFLLERHKTEGFEVPKHSHSSILLSMQLEASLHLEWQSESGGRNAVVDAGSLTLH